MIEEPSLLTIVRPAARRRPTAAQIAAFADLPTGFVVDAMDGRGAMDMAIKPVPGLPSRLHGPALTCDNRPGDVMALLAAPSQAQPGDVIVNAVAGWQGCAALGDRICGMARNAGAAGIVTDGPARDLAGIQAAGLPLFCTGLTPNSPVTSGPGAIGLPVLAGGLHVETGDIIVADEDGVVVVPFARIDGVLERVRQVMALEQALDARVAEGETGIDRVRAILDGPGVTWIG
ncbi:RraA family protein [Rhodobacteraceae bacterium 2CG4]|uniref:Putative 4-hydroxy-4-methyl-2-oxoglutarate aldolase n=1 Tax=Halovulum marinum TaxID=2662447 RepID=A0A6L5Z1Y2_9RHOB|nr:RraA family protein [Halovulum marinum]MSU90547.1 RraA family protein [Halovulum marinum]